MVLSPSSGPAAVVFPNLSLTSGSITMSPFLTLTSCLLVRTFAYVKPPDNPRLHSHLNIPNLNTSPKALLPCNVIYLTGFGNKMWPIFGGGHYSCLPQKREEVRMQNTTWKTFHSYRLVPFTISSLESPLGECKWEVARGWNFFLTRYYASSGEGGRETASSFR